MKYIPSHIVKREGIAYDRIEDSSAWVVEDGSFKLFMDRYYGGKAHEAILDIGCGGGATLRAAEPHFKKLYGLDLVSYLDGDMKEKVHFSTTDLNFEPLPYPDHSIDLVTAFQVIEHLENPFFVMREIKRVLKPGGLCIFSVPSPFQLTFKIKFLFTGNMPPWTQENDHLLFLTKDVFAKTYLAEFDLLETRYQRGDVPFWGRLRVIFGKKLIKKHLMNLPRTEFLGRRVCYVLRSKK